MPELPEVELAARRLGGWLDGERIDRVVVAPTRIVRGASPGEVERLLLGRRVRGIARRGKWLRIDCEDDRAGPRGSGAAGPALFSHLGMSGKWVRRSKDDIALQHERARFDAGAASVRYLDPRLFGRLVPSLTGEPIVEWKALGRDALDAGIHAEWLEGALGEQKRPIKIALLDQTLLCGLGNIQTTEALFRAGIHPERPAVSLTRMDAARLAAAIAGTLAETLADLLATPDESDVIYVEDAGAPNPFQVYGRGGKPCPRCQSMLSRIVLGGRGTVFCPRCQPREETGKLKLPRVRQKKREK